MAKSDAMLGFDLALSKLQDQIRNGDLKDPLAFGEAFGRILQRFMPGMTDEERDGIQKILLSAHSLGARLMAEIGTPIAGNDPSIRPQHGARRSVPSRHRHSICLLDTRHAGA
jgi:hypothetical protein